jgi:putative membrane protein
MLPLLHAAGDEWDWHLHPDAILFCVILLAGYVYVITQFRSSWSDAARVPRGQIWSFAAGVAVIWLGAGTLIHDWSERYLLSVHMFQHLLFTLVAPPLLIWGTPDWVWQAALRNGAVHRVARVATHPLVALGSFNAVIVLTHLPPVVNLALEVHAFHFGVHAILIVTALLMWWPVLSRIPELPRISYPFQMGYLFIQSIIPSVVASFITFSDRAVYTFYADAPRIWGISPITDQQMAGGVMKLLGSLILWCFIGYAFMQWYQRETAEEREPRWREVEQELDEMGLMPGGHKPH